MQDAAHAPVHALPGLLAAHAACQDLKGGCQQRSRPKVDEGLLACLGERLDDLFGAKKAAPACS